MEDHIRSAASSLERLRTLDLLPTIDDQLREAKKLCNHNARAEMLLKWLLPKIQSFAEWKVTTGAWELLCDIFRLLQPQRLAMFLKSVNLCSIASERVVLECSETVFAVVSCLELLFDLSHGPNGIPLVAYLSFDSTLAAPLLASWLRVVNTVLPHQHVQCDATINLALRIWDCRIRHETDDMLFAAECLQESAQFCASWSAICQDRRRKRKQAIDGSFASSPSKLSVEYLIARHVFAPARSEYLGHLNQQDQTKAGPDLKERLAALASNSPDQDSSKIRSTLFGSALLQSTRSTSRQRLHDANWHDQLFETLRVAVILNNPICSVEEVCRMLTALHEKNAKLSEGYLMKLWNIYYKSEADKVEWAFVVAVIMSSPVMVRHANLTSSLFTDMSRAVAKHSSDPNQKRGGLWWKNGILVPLMNEYASNRNLAEFIQLWHGQLLRAGASGHISVWMSLTKALGTIIESSLTQDQLVATLRYHRTALESATSDPVDIDTRENKQSASLAVIHALVSEISNQESTDAILGDVVALIQHLTNALSASEGAPCNHLSMLSQTWSVMRISLDMSFAKWTTIESEETIAKSLESVISSNVIFKSMGSTSAGKTVNFPHPGFTQEAVLEAKRFQLAVYRILRSHAQCMDTKTDDRTMQPVIGVCPHVECFNDRSTFDTDYLVVAKQMFDWKPNDWIEHCRAFASAFMATPQPKPALNLLLKRLVPEQGASAKCSTEFDIKSHLGILAEIPLSLLSNKQREVSLDYATEVTLPWADELLQQTRLAVILHLLAYLCADAAFWSDGDLIWHKINSLCTNACKSKLQTGSRENIEGLVEYLVSMLMKNLHRLEKNNALNALTTRAVQYLNELQDYSGEDYAASLAFLGPILREMKPEREPLIRDKLDAFVENAISILKTPNVFTKPREITRLSNLLHTLTYAPSYCLWRASAIAHLTNSVIAGFAQALKIGNNSVPTSAKYVLLRSLQLMGHRPEAQLEPDMIVSTTLFMLEAELDTKHFREALEAFGRIFELSNAQTKARTWGNLVAQSQRTAAMQLIETAISTLERDDFVDGTEESHWMPHSVFLQILNFASGGTQLENCRTVCRCIKMILLKKGFVTNQHTIETTMVVMKKLTENSIHQDIQFLDICSIITTLFQQHRSRLEDRMNILVNVFQAMVTSLFERARAGSTVISKHARALARLLQLLCSRPQRYGHAKASGLVDEARKAQARVGQHIQQVLHHYCSQVLCGTLPQEAKEALTPGLWMALEAMEMADADSVKVLSAAMNSSERAILRGLYEEWKVSAKWKAG
ncbi:hypothetical protein K470DRAFT_260059 [Piedraia hortae CBS 480.64]|uniref:Nucleolar 27S pre-rRNA processing Urb2/Npa2 C-terminal domain-containing protein n=1 Tax=Piedraia hortae CBS 480.64 TaxID=1314780 RepID=A0A6A7BSE9_9PEZI|nr:hypothetical protein K470DRAFT_260059 [Piedraia hortae CBS 480.64]